MVDVERGELRPAQRVVIVGPRIQAVGRAGAVRLPKGARVIDARGKYLIPGLWDLHVHPMQYADVAYPLFLANGVTGVRNAWSNVSLDTLTQWRREVLAGTRLGPPRQLLSGAAVDEGNEECTRTALSGHICVKAGDTADARQLVEALKAAGADILKMYDVSEEMYFILAAAARRAGLPFGGHAQAEQAVDVADSGARIIDHPQLRMKSKGLYALCLNPGSASIEQCRPVADRLRRHGTWYVPTLFAYYTTPEVSERFGPHGHVIADGFQEAVEKFWSDSMYGRNWLRTTVQIGASTGTESSRAATDSPGSMSIAQRVGLPILAGTDAVDDNRSWGFSLHAELAMYVAEGLTPLNALQSATLNPAKMWHATDSLGTVAPGKLADLVLLDANPLEDITNTTTIRAVVANGRFFDRTALDRLLTEVRAQATGDP